MADPIAKHPKELWILVLTEICERFSSWGIGNLLVLYTIEYYQFSHVQSTRIYGIFTGFATFSPLIGGWIASRWNYHSPMLLGAILNAVGCFMIASGIFSLFYPALLVIALGYGIFTPSILTILGFTYRKHPHLREAGFSIYYASISVGVFLAMVTLSAVAKWSSWDWAFVLAGIVQLIGLIPLIGYIIYHRETCRALQEFHKDRNSRKPLSPIEKDRIRVISAFFFICFLFWVAYNQAFSSIEIFTRQFMNRTIGSWEIPEGVFLSSQSLFLILLTPVLSYLYIWLQKRKLDPPASQKMGLSLLFMAVSFLIMVTASLGIPAGASSASVSYGYVIVSFFAMALGEMLLGPIGLSTITRLMPHRYHAIAVGLWYICIGLAFFVGGMLASLMDSLGSLAWFFSLFVLMTLLPGAVMLCFAKQLTRMSH